MLEFMGTSNEHIFPIDCDFVQFVAVLSPPNSHPPAARRTHAALSAREHTLNPRTQL